MNKFSVIGQSVPRIDGWAKATGSAMYTDDLSLPGMLIGKLLRSPHAHARILSIDVSKALALPGVKAVITGNDPVTNKTTHWRMRPQLADMAALASDRVRFLGEEVAAVAAVDEDTAIEALSLIKVEYEPLPGVFTIEEAIAENAPRVHDEFDRNINPSVSLPVSYGDVEKGFAESFHVRTDKFSTPTVIHAYMEPHSALASYEPPGKLTLWASTATPYYLKGDVAQVMGLRESDVRVIKPYLGGNFGGRNVPFALDFCAGLLSMRSGKPVKITYDRKEEFNAAGRRHAARLELKTGVSKEGILLAKEISVYLDGGAYNGFGPTVTFLSGLYHTVVYRLPNYKFNGYRVYTNNPIAIGMRGFCGPQAHFAAETQMDMIAEDLGMDPVELRLKNVIKTGEIVPTVGVIKSCGLTEALNKVSSAVNWSGRPKEKGTGKGMAITCFGQMSGANFNFYNTPYAYSGAEIRAYPDGTLTLFSLAADVGQGSDTLLCQIAAEELGLKIGDVRFIGNDTAVDPVDLGAYSSRQTMFSGNAVLAAARDLKQQLFEAASPKLETSVIHELEARDGRIQVKGSAKRGMTFGEAVMCVLRAKGGKEVSGFGTYTPRGKGTATPAVGYGVAAAEVEVNKETGVTRVTRFTMAHDCGTNINPMAVEGQVYGSIQMGLGYALSEKLIIDKGRVMNANFLDYKMPSTLDMPEMVSFAIDTVDPEGPFGAKESGEGPINCVAPAITNAVYNAVGFRVMELPVRPDDILGLRKDKKG